MPSVEECTSPLLWSCEHGCCLVARPCRNHRESRCSPCATRYRRRVCRLFEYGLTHGSRPLHGAAYLLTLNAPGDPGHQRWVPGRRGLHGPCPCHQHRAAGDGRWNASAGSRWNLVATRLRQHAPGLVYARAVEVQRRGLLHLHVLLWSPEELDPRHVQTLALDAGFGCVLELAPLLTAEKAARYCAKYVTKSLDSREDVPWLQERVDLTTGEVTTHRQPTFRAWSSSRSWGIRMAEIVAISARAAALHRARALELHQALADEAATTQPQPASAPARPPDP